MPAVLRYTVLAVIAFWSAAAADSDDITTCGGYIRSSVPIPYQNIKIKLLTRSGNMKAEAEGAPNSGYFLLPAYDRGHFKLRVEGPTGWTFEPAEVDLHLDGSRNDLCSKGKDIDFTFKGFSVIGKVVSAGSPDGPEGVPVTLVDKGSRRTVLTQKGGNYVFPAVMPGVYQLEFRTQTSEVKITNDNFIATKSTSFVIEGYSIQGSVKWTDSRPSSAWAVLAVSGALDDTAAGTVCCGRNPQPSRQLPKVEGFSLPSNFRIGCVVPADLGSGGSFEFPCVKSASTSYNYAVIPVAMTKTGKAMDVRPDNVAVELSHGDHRVEPFEVTGFPVEGQIEDAGEGVEVQVEETGYETVTDSAGRFRLTGLRNGQYTLKLTKRGIQFDPKKVKVDADHTQLPVLRPDRFEVCGEALIADAVEMHFVNAGKSGELTRAFSDVSSGRFCAMLIRGDYILRPMGRVRLSPSEVSFSVPVPAGKRFIFSQFQATVAGQVSCVGGVCAGVRVELLAAGGASIDKQTAYSTGTFRFERVDPGTYEICVSHASLCFEKDCQGITVVDKNLNDVRFAQKGFVLRLDSTHSAELEIAGRVLKVKAGLSTHCVVEQKPTPLKVLGCHRFAKSSQLLFKPRNEETVKLVAETHRLKVNIHTKIVVKDLKLTAKSGDDVQSLEFKQEPATSSDSQGVPSYTYSGELYFGAGKEILLEANSGSLVFRPSQTTVRMPNDCHSVDLQGKTGIFIQGSVKPAIAGVEIVVTPDTAGAAGTDAVRVVTDAQGNYKAGPLESMKYSIEGFKEGYAFERVGDTNNLSGIKFSRVDIVVLQRDTRTPLVGALVSVTGGPEYRNNSRTGPRGELSLIKLAPGSYYIRVMMKEYKFEPVSEMIEVTENSEKRVEIFGKKVAYSLMGKVTSITGEAEPDVELEATSEACDRHEEDARSDENGNFRIRGLRENCVYRLQLKRGESESIDGSTRPRFERTLPTSREVRVGREDQTIDVVVVRPQKGTQVSVAVDADKALLPSLRVVVSVGGNPVYTLQAASFVVLPAELPTDGREYTFELQHVSGANLVGNGSKRNGDGSTAPSTQATVRADRGYHHVELHTGATPASVAGDTAAGGLESGGAPPTPFVAIFSVFVVLAAVFRNDISEFLHRRQQDSPNASGDRRNKNKTR